MALRPVRSVFLRAEARRDPVYVIPPRKALRTMDGYLDLSDLPEDPTRRHVAVDLFFRTLADTHGSHAVAVVLSGLDSDGASAIKRINERGGLTIAQDPESEHSGMPRAAIATGMIDGVWPLRDIPGGCSTRGRRGIFTRRNAVGAIGLTGTRSIADPYLFVVTRWAIAKGVDMRGLGHLSRFVDRMYADRGVQAALEAEEGRAAA